MAHKEYYERRIKLKESYTKPNAKINTFSTVDVITTSTGGDDVRDPIELPDL